MRTWVKPTPFDPPILSSAIAAPPRVLADLPRRGLCRLRRARPDVIGRKARAFLRLLERRPMAATRQNLALSALDRLRKSLRGGRGRDGVVLAGHEKRRSPQAAKVGAFGAGQRLARLGEALRVLTQVAFPNIGDGDGIGGLCRRG